MPVSEFQTDRLPMLPLYQTVLSAGIGGLPAQIERLSGESSEWVQTVAQVKGDPNLIELLSGIRITYDSIRGYGSEHIDQFLWGLSLAGTLVRDLNTGVYHIDSERKQRMYERNMARLKGQENKIGILSYKLAELAK